MKEKVVKSIPEELIKDGMTIAISGMGSLGYPRELIRQLRDIIIKKNTKDLTLIYIENNAVPDEDIDISAICLPEHVKEVHLSHLGIMFKDEEFLSKVKVNIYPMGVLCQKIKAGSMHIPGILIEKKIGELYRDNDYLVKNIINLNDKEVVLEEAFKADLGIITATTGDKYGNLSFNRSEYNSHDIAQMSDYCIAEVEEVVDMIEYDKVDIENCWINNIIIGKKLEELK